MADNIHSPHNQHPVDMTDNLPASPLELSGYETDTDETMLLTQAAPAAAAPKRQRRNIAAQPFSLPQKKASVLDHSSWRLGLALAIMLALLPTMAGFLHAPGSLSVGSRSRGSEATSVPLPPPTDMRVEAITPEAAEAANAEQPLSTDPIVPARPFVIPLTGEFIPARLKATQCLTEAIYYEAASEDIIGQRAVAQVVLNRVRHPAYPKSVCGVVYQGSERGTGCQFTFTCDGSLARAPNPALWNRARVIADAALSGSVETSVGTATHYHTRWVRPYWAPTLDKMRVIGAHIFYRWKGFWGTSGAFAGHYSPQQEMAVAVRGMPGAPQDGTDGLGMASDAWATMATPPSAMPPLSPLPRAATPLAADTIVPLSQPGSASLAADIQRGNLVADESRGQLVVDGQ
jgi:hypothetical protein